MNYYPLLESRTNPHFQAAGFVSLANFPPTEDFVPQDVYVYGTQAIDGRWVIYPCGLLHTGRTKRFDRTSASFNPDASVFFFMSKSGSMPETLSSLPEPTSFQHSTPRWRGTLGVRIGDFETSYSGEYPDEMLPLQKSTCLSISPLLQVQDTVETEILFVNMLLRPVREMYRAKLFDAETKAVIGETKVVSNEVSVIRLNNLFQESLSVRSNSSGLKRLYHFAVEGVTGIPVYLSYCRISRGMSLEHSHPPIEFAVFAGRDAQRSLVRGMKSFWFGS